MFCVKDHLSITLLCFCVVACNQTGNKDDNADKIEIDTSAATSSLTPAASVTLHDIWVLDSINKTPIDPADYSHGTPYFHFDLETKTVKGHTGCNGVSGLLKVKGEKISFDSLVVAKQTCKNDKGFDKKIVRGFKKGNLSYKIVNDKLYLDMEPGSLFIFRRIRR